MMICNILGDLNIFFDYFNTFNVVKCESQETKLQKRDSS